jgi:hypothetical protein
MENSIFEQEKRLFQLELQAVGFSKAAIREICDRTGDLEEHVIHPFSMIVDDTPVEVTAYLEHSPPNFVYHLTRFELRLARYIRGFVEANTFSCHSDYWVNVRQAFNLMAGRSVYRSAAVDPLNQGYWIKLSEKGVYSGYRCLLFNRTGFRVEAGLKKAGVWDLMDVDERSQMVQAMESGGWAEMDLTEAGETHTYRLKIDDDCEQLSVEDFLGIPMQLPPTLFSQTRDNDQAES